jgi:hypothetical protein
MRLPDLACGRWCLVKCPLRMQGLAPVEGHSSGDPRVPRPNECWPSQGALRRWGTFMLTLTSDIQSCIHMGDI